MEQVNQFIKTTKTIPLIHFRILL